MRRVRHRTRSAFVAALLAIAVAAVAPAAHADDPGTEGHGECIEITANVKVLHLTPLGFDQWCVRKTGCSDWISWNPGGAGSPGLLWVMWGTKVPHPTHPTLLCLIA